MGFWGLIVFGWCLGQSHGQGAWQFENNPFLEIFKPVSPPGDVSNFVPAFNLSQIPQKPPPQYFGPPGTVWINVPYPQNDQQVAAVAPPSVNAPETQNVQPAPPISQPPAQAINDPPADLADIPIPIDPISRWCLKPRGQFPTQYCNTFVNCWDGNAIEQFCPPTLVFNPVGCHCDYIYNVDCRGKPLKLDSSTDPSPGGGWPSDGSYKPPPTTGSGWPSDGSYKPPPISETGWPSDGSYRPPPSSGTGWPTDGSYKPPVIISPPIKPQPPIVISPPIIIPPIKPSPPILPLPPVHPIKPLPPTLPPVTLPPITLPPTIPPVNPGLKKYCLKPRGQFASSTCNKYVNCWDDIVIEQECPEGLNFNPKKGYCDYPDNYPCKNILPPVILPYHDENECPEPIGIFRSKHQCNSYYTCRDYVIVSQNECPKGYLFNDKFGVCDFEHRVNCSAENKGYTKQTQILPKAVVDPSIPCREGTVFRLNEDCSKAAICRNGLTEIIHCPQGLSYDVITDKCVESNFAKC